MITSFLEIFVKTSDTPFPCLTIQTLHLLQLSQLLQYAHQLLHTPHYVRTTSNKLGWNIFRNQFNSPHRHKRRDSLKLI